MKIKGHKLEPPKPVDVIIPRGPDEQLHLKVQAVVDWDEFDKVVAFPAPPMITRPGKKPEPDEKDENYIKARIEWYNKRRGFLYLKALSATEELEWESMTLKDPATWSHDAFVAECKTAGMTAAGVAYLIRVIDRVNMMDEKHMEEVRNRFLAQEAASSS